MANPLAADGIRFSYRDRPVLDGISFELRAGEILGILGPNGSGKSTLLKNLNRNLSPSGGTVLVDGRDIADMPKRDIAGRVSVVPQSNEVQFAFTAREIVEMGRMPFQKAFGGLTSRDEEIVRSAMERTGLSGMEDRPVNTMSGGERQRVIIARAIAQEPEVLLMDEPTLHLDISMQFESLDLVRELADSQGVGVVIVSHDLPMVTRYCDRMILIRDRRIFAVGAPEEVLTPENIDAVFGIDGRFEIDERGAGTVRLFGSSRRR